VISGLPGNSCGTKRHRCRTSRLSASITLACLNSEFPSKLKDFIDRAGGTGYEKGNRHTRQKRQIPPPTFMEKKTRSNFWPIVLTLGFWMLILTAAQGLGLYYLVTRYISTKISVQTNTIDRQTERVLTEMKTFPSLEEVKNIRDNLDKIDKELSAKMENMERDILKDVTPSLRITSGKPIFVSSNQVKFAYAIQNKGRYSVNINNVKLYLSTDKITSIDKIKDQLTINKDYYVQSNTKTEDITPGYEVHQDFTIAFPDPHNIPGTIYYCVTFDAQTDPNIIKSIKTIDQEKIINKKPYYITGDIVTPG
jgi:hypothetical protein